MKQLKVFLAVASAVILCSCNSNSGNHGTPTTKSIESETTAPQGSVVYIQMDSLVNQYDMFNDLKTELESKAQTIKDDLEKQGRAFESSAKDFQAKVTKGLLTRAQAEEQQQRLMEKERSLNNLSQQKQMEMAEEQDVLYRKVLDAIKTYLVKYNEEKGFALILTTSAASNSVIVGNASLDITKNVLVGLNEEYVKSKK
ncbi:MAG: OmpH family outer membrane protein [Bacteroidales bacterium]